MDLADNDRFNVYICSATPFGNIEAWTTDTSSCDRLRTIIDWAYKWREHIKNQDIVFGG